VNQHSSPILKFSAFNDIRHFIHNLELSTFNLELSTFNLQPSTFNFQPSTFNFQLSTFNLQLSTRNFELRPTQASVPHPLLTPLSLLKAMSTTTSSLLPHSAF